VRPARRFGAIALDGDRVTSFEEKPDDDGGWINGGFFLLSPSVGDFIEGDHTTWEREPMPADPRWAPLIAPKNLADDTRRDYGRMG
jgi:NDP-sugar pyrophosphorylase family protein